MLQVLLDPRVLRLPATTNRTRDPNTQRDTRVSTANWRLTPPSQRVNFQRIACYSCPGPDSPSPCHSPSHPQFLPPFSFQTSSRCRAQLLPSPTAGSQPTPT